MTLLPRAGFPQNPSYGNSNKNWKLGQYMYVPFIMTFFLFISNNNFHIKTQKVFFLIPYFSNIYSLELHISNGKLSNCIPQCQKANFLRSFDLGQVVWSILWVLDILQFYLFNTAYKAWYIIVLLLNFTFQAWYFMCRYRVSPKRRPFLEIEKYFWSIQLT